MCKVIGGLRTSTTKVAAKVKLREDSDAVKFAVHNKFLRVESGRDTNVRHLNCIVGEFARTPRLAFVNGEPTTISTFEFAAKFRYLQERIGLVQRVGHHNNASVIAELGHK